MGRLLPSIALLTLALTLRCAAQTVDDLDSLWHESLQALRTGKAVHAQEIFGQFNEALRQYWATPGQLDWKSQYLAGSLYCQFPQSRTTGAAILQNLLQNVRDLNSAGQGVLRSLLSACSNQRDAPSDSVPNDIPVDIINAAAHYQMPGVHGATKGGYLSLDDGGLSGTTVSHVAVAELLARRVSRSEPQKALDAALQRLPAGAGGSIVDGFVVTMEIPDTAQSRGIGHCLVAYSEPLRQQFQIALPSDMITVYTVRNTAQLYRDARTLHGLALPLGVGAYSVAEDLSISGMADAHTCGSLAHELVHLSIKSSFPISPPWLEEGLASEIAVATPAGSRFKFYSSWRDDVLQRNWSLRPTVGKLLDLSWSDLSAATPQDLKRAAAVQAMVAVFIRYLAAKGELVDIYFEVRDHTISADLHTFRTSREIIEAKLGMGQIDEVDRDFVTWFQGSASPNKKP